MFKKLLLSALLAFASLGAFAAGTATTTVTGIAGDSSGYVFVYLTAAITGSPGCVTGNHYFVIDPSTQAGKNEMALLTTAMYSGKTVTANGTNTCSLSTGLESLAYVWVSN